MKKEVSQAYEKAKANVDACKRLAELGIHIEMVPGGWKLNGKVYPLLTEALKAARRLS